MERPKFVSGTLDAMTRPLRGIHQVTATYCFAVVLPEKCLMQVGKQLVLNVQQHLQVK